MRVCRAFILVAALALVGARVGAAQTFYSTGTDTVLGSDGKWIDQHWLVSTGYGGFSLEKFVSAHLWPHGTEHWITDAGAQMWQYFTFRQYVDLSGYDAPTASLRFRWGCDDVPENVGGFIEPVFRLNGAGDWLGGGTCGHYGIYDSWGSEATVTGFKPGQNYIDFRVQGNHATNGMGLTVLSFAAEPDQFSTVPEPATVVLFASGLLGLGVVTLVRRKA